MHLWQLCAGRSTDLWGNWSLPTMQAALSSEWWVIVLVTAVGPPTVLGTFYSHWAVDGRLIWSERAWGPSTEYQTCTSSHTFDALKLDCLNQPTNSNFEHTTAWLHAWHVMAINGFDINLILLEYLWFRTQAAMLWGIGACFWHLVLYDLSKQLSASAS